MIHRLLSSVVDVRRQELPRILPLTLAYGLVMASLYVLKPVRNALFLDKLGVEQLPYVLLMVALVGAGVAVLFARLSQRARLDRIIPVVFLILLSNLLLFWLVLPRGWAWSFYLFYVWVSIYGLMATSLLWLLANALFDAREARRLFGFIGAAGIGGAIAGGAVTSWIVSRVGTENLLIVCSGMLLASLLLLYFVRSRQPAAPKSKQAVTQNVWETLRGSDLLRLLAGMAALVAVVAAIVDVQFNDIADRAFPSKDAKTAFFGQFFAYLSALAFLFQVFVTPRFLRKFGVVSALLFLPASLAVGSVALLAVPGLLAGMLVKLGDGGFRHSIHKSAVEILFLPIPAAIKQRTKVLVDTTVDNLCTGLGAVLVLVATSVFGVSYQHLSFLSLALIVLWMALVFHGRGAYVNSFRQALERREIDVGGADRRYQRGGGAGQPGGLVGKRERTTAGICAGHAVCREGPPSCGTVTPAAATFLRGSATESFEGSARSRGCRIARRCPTADPGCRTRRQDRGLALPQYPWGTSEAAMFRRRREQR